MSSFSLFLETDACTVRRDMKTSFWITLRDHSLDFILDPLREAMKPVRTNKRVWFSFCCALLLSKHKVVVLRGQYLIFYAPLPCFIVLIIGSPFVCIWTLLKELFKGPSTYCQLLSARTPFSQNHKHDCLWAWLAVRIWFQCIIPEH